MVSVIKKMFVVSDHFSVDKSLPGSPLILIVHGSNSTSAFFPFWIGAFTSASVILRGSNNVDGKLLLLPLFSLEGVTRAVGILNLIDEDMRIFLNRSRISECRSM